MNSLIKNLNLDKDELATICIDACTGKVYVSSNLIYDKNQANSFIERVASLLGISTSDIRMDLKDSFVDFRDKYLFEGATYKYNKANSLKPTPKPTQESSNKTEEIKTVNDPKPMPKEEAEKLTAKVKSYLAKKNGSATIRDLTKSCMKGMHATTAFLKLHELGFEMSIPSDNHYSSVVVHTK